MVQSAKDAQWAGTISVLKCDRKVLGCVRRAETGLRHCNRFVGATVNAMNPIVLGGTGFSCDIAVWHRRDIGGFGPVRRRRVRDAAFALLALTSTTHAQSVLFTYDQWERLSIGLRDIYLSGAMRFPPSPFPLKQTPPSTTTTVFDKSK